MSPALTDWFAHPKHGPLPALLLALTVATGLIDAVSILGLGRVFVANMTGNVVFIGFGLAGAPGYSVTGSLVALVGFLAGAVVAGQLISRRTVHRGRLLRTAMTFQLGLILAALVVAVAVGPDLGLVAQLVIVALASVGLGLQNAAVRQLAVPDLTTTVLTMTLTGIGSDLHRRDRAALARRVLAVAAMLVGAAIGALLVLQVGLSAGLGGAALQVLAVLVVAGWASRTPAAWQQAG